MPDTATATATLTAPPAQSADASVTKPPTARPRRSAGERLREAVLALAAGHGQMRSHHEKAWASITFAGTRHEFTLLFEGDAAITAGEQFIADLPDHEFFLPRQLVADATIAAVEHEMLPNPRLVVVCEVLMLEDG